MTDGTEIQFVTELPGRTGGGRFSTYGPLLQALIDHGATGEWALVAEFEKASQAGSAAGHLRHDAPKPEGHYFSFASRGSQVFARYDGTTPLPDDGKVKPGRKPAKK